MKKLMIAAAIVCAAAMSQAASYQWYDSNADIMVSGSAPDGVPVAEGTTVYLFDTTSVSQQQALDMFFGSGLSGYIADATSDTDADGNINAVTFSDEKVAGTDSDWDGFYALINGDEIFISDTAAFTVQKGVTQDVAFDDHFDYTTAPALETKTFEGAGWYTQSVPEPTSGLLLLLGMAGLALRRRRA